MRIEARAAGPQIFARGVLVAGSHGDELRLTLGPEWQRYETLNLIFRNGSKQIEVLYRFGGVWQYPEGIVPVPWEAEAARGHLYLTLCAVEGEQIAYTARMEEPVPVLESGAREGEDGSAYTPDLLQQILNAGAASTRAAEHAEAAAEEAEAAAEQAAAVQGASVAVGTVTTGAAGSEASVVNAGTESDAVLNFVIPRGDRGEKGETGAQGECGATGPAGANGVTPNVQAGTTTTLPAGSSASVTRRADSPDSAPVFDFAIPRGEAGAGGGDMEAGVYDPAGGAKQVAFSDELETVSAAAAAAQSAAEAAQAAAEGKLPLSGGTLSGSLTVEGHANPIGAFYEKSISASVAHDTSVNVQSMNCSAGRWLITAFFQYSVSNWTGYRSVTLSTSGASLDSGGTDMRGAVENAGLYVSASRVFSLSKTTTIYCIARQTGGEAATVSGKMTAVRLA